MRGEQLDKSELYPKNENITFHVASLSGSLNLGCACIERPVIIQ